MLVAVTWARFPLNKAFTSADMTPALPQVAEHMVSITKAVGAKVGLVLRGEDGGSLRIVKVEEEGLIPNWNKENPSHRLQRGDRIVEVNGVCGDSPAMAELCKTSSTLNLLFRYTSELEQRHLMMQYRTLGPEEFDLLRVLDKAIPPRTSVRRSFVAQLPRVKASACGLDKCSICLQEWHEDDMITRLPCQHYFCTKCIEQWLTQCRAQCPLCLAPVYCPAEDEDASTQSSLVDEGFGSDIGKETEGGECVAMVHASSHSSTIISATRCAGLRSRTCSADSQKAAN